MSNAGPDSVANGASKTMEGLHCDLENFGHDLQTGSRMYRQSPPDHSRSSRNHSIKLYLHNTAQSRSSSRPGVSDLWSLGRSRCRGLLHATIIICPMRTPFNQYSRPSCTNFSSPAGLTCKIHISFHRDVGLFHNA